MLWLCYSLAEQEVRGSIPGLAATISEIRYFLLPSRDKAKRSLKRRKSSKQRTTQQTNVADALLVLTDNWCTLIVSLLAYTVVIYGCLDTKFETRCPGGVSITCLASRFLHFCSLISFFILKYSWSLFIRCQEIPAGLFIHQHPWHLEFLHILVCLLNSSYILAWIWMKVHHKSRSACGEIIYVWQILAELWSLSLRIFTHFSFSSQLLQHPCMDLNESLQGYCTTNLEVHVGR